MTLAKQELLDARQLYSGLIRRISFIMRQKRESLALE